MADNYIEKQMADFRAGRIGVPRRRTVAPALPRATVADTGDDCVTEAIVRALRAEGRPVSFSMADIRRGNLLAQQTGARYYPPYSLTDSNK